MLDRSWQYAVTHDPTPLVKSSAKESSHVVQQVNSVQDQDGTCHIIVGRE